MHALHTKPKPNARICIWSFIFAVWATFFGWGYYDREPPITFHGSALAEIPKGRFGDEIIFDNYVDRHLGRKCSMTLQRYTVDSTHAKRRYTEDDDFVSADGREARQLESPGHLVVPITIPKLPPGPAKLVTEARFTCPFNLTTYLIPISTSYSWPFEVLPPATSASAAER